MPSNQLRSGIARVPVDRHGRTARHLARARDDYEYLEWREWERKATPKPASIATLANDGRYGQAADPLPRVPDCRPHSAG